MIFDCFGVLAHDGWLPFRTAHFANDEQKFIEATDLNKRSNAGFIGYNDFLQQVGSLAGISASDARSEIEDNPTDVSLFDYIRQDLKPKYKIGMLSNASDYHLNDIFTEEQISLFDEVVLSYQVGAVKPDSSMYMSAAIRLGVLPEECLFIDDQPRFVEGAKQVGMQAFVFNDTETTITKIKEILNA